MGFQSIPIRRAELCLALTAIPPSSASSLQLSTGGALVTPRDEEPDAESSHHAAARDHTYPSNAPR